ncbi:amidase [Rathayibacter sp. YIM 133350]|uniref:amidase n=1 Tax=Rathayibacter sp. YIM 133350 TaxID=3131992 RepID=UPI00307F646C
MQAIHEYTALEQWRLLQSGDITPTQIARHYLERIARIDPSIGAFVTVTEEEGLRRAIALEAGATRAAPLWGLPIADKDLWRRAGVPTGFGSRLFDGYVPDESDEIVRTIDRAGAVSLGKTAAPEFGLPAYTESRAHGATRNPWDLTRGPGGSSGGAAAAVAAGLLPFAPGSDGGGSVRIPAAACGLVGLKPSRGRVPAGSGLDSLGGLVVDGPIARTVADAALLLDALVQPAGAPAEHHYAVRAPGEDGPFLASAIRGEGRFQLGVMTTSPWDEAHDVLLEPEALAALDAAVAGFTALGHGMESVRLTHVEMYAPAFRVLWQAGAAAIPAETDAELDLLEPLTRWLVARGRGLTARELSEALTTLTAFERSLIDQLSPFDAVLTPALAMTPRPIGWYDAEDGDRNFAQQVQYTPFTSMINVAGLPAIVLPVHETASGLPMGVQLIGRPGGEATLLALGAQLERRIRWQHRHPATWSL